MSEASNERKEKLNMAEADYRIATCEGQREIKEAIQALPNATQAAADNANAAATAANNAVAQLGGLVAETYSSSATYSVGDYVYYNGYLYRCIQAITTAEAWTAAHWRKKALGNDVDDLHDWLVKSYDVRDVPFFVSGKYINTSGNEASNDSWYTTFMIPVHGDAVYIEGRFSNLSGAGYNLAMYNAEGGFIGGYNLGIEVITGKFMDVSEAAYIRISNIKTEAAKFGYSAFWKAAAIVEAEAEEITLNFNVEGYLKTDGTVASASSDWSCTGFIPVRHLGMFLSGRWYSLEGAGYNACWYDAQKNFIGGMAVSSYEELKFADISEAAYVRFSSHDPFLTTPSVLFAFKKEDQTPEVVVDINGSGDYISLLEAMKDTADTVPIRLMPGEYDLITEYEAYYGADFFTNYDGYSGVSDPYYRGLWMGPGRKIRGEAGAVIKCEYTGSNNQVATKFSAIANAGNTLLENVTIKHSNLRYAIHDDYGAANQTIEWRKIRFI